MVPTPGTLSLLDEPLPKVTAPLPCERSLGSMSPPLSVSVVPCVVRPRGLFSVSLSSPLCTVNGPFHPKNSATTVPPTGTPSRLKLPEVILPPSPSTHRSFLRHRSFTTPNSPQLLDSPVLSSHTPHTPVPDLIVEFRSDVSGWVQIFRT